MIKQLILVVLAISAVLAIVASRKPDRFLVERSVVIKAPPEKVFALINDFRRVSVWSPLDSLDPAMARWIGGAPSGRGAVYEWRGNLQAGAGRVEIVESRFPTQILMRAELRKPIRASGTVEYVLAVQPDSSTKVTWSTYGPSPFASKVVQVFLTMDDVVGRNVESGLNRMKVAAEK
jgi:uncharacterized protein YndB with AHSA1/START domain